MSTAHPRPSQKQGPAPAKKSPPPPLSLLQRAQRALESQCRPQSLAACLSEAEQEAIAATLDASDFAGPETADVVREVVTAYYDRHKAVDGDHDGGIVEPPADAGE